MKRESEYYRAFKIVTAKLKKDKALWEAWESAIACSYVDAETNYKKIRTKKYLHKRDKFIIALNAANDFLKLLCD